MCFIVSLSLSLSLSLPLPAMLILIASCGTKFQQSILMGKFLLDFPFHCLVKMEIEPLREKQSTSKCMDKLRKSQWYYFASTSDQSKKGRHFVFRQRQNEGRW
jgi:hypothetical protein